MTKNNSDAGVHIVDVERYILRAMCSGALAAGQIDAARESLHDYTWRDEEHRVVFEAIQRARNVNTISLREQLPAHATRMGFPDVNWPLYFGSNSCEPAPQSFDLRDLLHKLRQLVAQQ